MHIIFIIFLEHLSGLIESARTLFIHTEYVYIFLFHSNANRFESIVQYLNADRSWLTDSFGGHFSSITHKLLIHMYI